MFSFRFVFGLLLLHNAVSLDTDLPGVGGLNIEGLFDQYEWNELAPANIANNDIKIKGDDAPCATFYETLCSDVEVGTGKAASCIKEKFASDKDIQE